MLTPSNVLLSVFTPGAVRVLFQSPSAPEGLVSGHIRASDAGFPRVRTYTPAAKDSVVSIVNFKYISVRTFIRKLQCVYAFCLSR